MFTLNNRFHTCRYLSPPHEKFLKSRISSHPTVSRGFISFGTMLRSLWSPLVLFGVLWRSLTSAALNTNQLERKFGDGCFMMGIQNSENIYDSGLVEPVGYDGLARKNRLVAFSLFAAGAAVQKKGASFITLNIEHLPTTRVVTLPHDPRVRMYIHERPFVRVYWEAEVSDSEDSAFASDTTSRRRLDKEKYLINPSEMDQLNLAKVERFFFTCLVSLDKKSQQVTGISRKYLRSFAEALGYPISPGISPMQVMLVRSAFAKQLPKMFDVITGNAETEPTTNWTDQEVLTFVNWGVAQHLKMELAAVKCDVILPFDRQELSKFSWKNLHCDDSLKRTLHSEIDTTFFGQEVLTVVANNTRNDPSPNFAKLLLFHGPPGTGKTTAATIIAKETNVPIVIFKIEDILSKWIGEAEQRVASVLKKSEILSSIFARGMAPGGILFIDEIDSVAQKRSGREGGESQTMNRLLTTLLRHIEGGFGQRSRLILIGATNVQSQLDDALISRATMVHFPAPGFHVRKALIHDFARQLNDTEVTILANILEDKTGRDIKNMALSAERTFVQDYISSRRRDFYSKEGIGQLPKNLVPSFEYYKEAATEKVRMWQQAAEDDMMKRSAGKSTNTELADMLACLNAKPNEPPEDKSDDNAKDELRDESGVDEQSGRQQSNKVNSFRRIQTHDRKRK